MTGLTGIPHIKLPGPKQRAILDESHSSITHECRQQSNQAHKTIYRRRELAAARQRRKPPKPVPSQSLWAAFCPGRLPGPAGQLEGPLKGLVPASASDLGRQTGPQVRSGTTRRQQSARVRHRRGAERMAARKGPFAKLRGRGCPSPTPALCQAIPPHRLR